MYRESFLQSVRPFFVVEQRSLTAYLDITVSPENVGRTVYAK